MVKSPIVAYVPPGYALRDRQEGALILGFGGVDGQVALAYARSTELVDLVLPLTVHTGPPDAPSLSCTENRNGVEIPLAGGAATYHDGWWAPGDGYAAQWLPDGSVFHWGREDVHSVTVRTPNATLAVRGARSRGIGLDELCRVAASVTVG
jgi:hypothetical protein